MDIPALLLICCCGSVCYACSKHKPRGVSGECFGVELVGLGISCRFFDSLVFMAIPSNWWLLLVARSAKIFSRRPQYTSPLDRRATTIA